MSKRAIVHRSKLTENFGFSLIHLSRWWRTRLDARLNSRCENLTHAKAATLMALFRRNQAVSQKLLAQDLAIEAPTLVPILDALEKQALVTRVPCTEDRRVRQISLSKRAHPLVVEIKTVAQELREEILKDVTDEELETCLRVFNKILVQDNHDSTTD